MNDKLLAIKGAITAIITGLAAFLGWKGILAVVWVAVMALDYISGTFAACKSGEWSSGQARQGLWHKSGMILVVLVAAITDGVFAVVGDHFALGINWTGLLLPLTLVWYIITEIGSILENAVKLGVKVPTWLVKILKISLKSIDTAGDAATGNDDKEGNNNG